MVSYIKYKLQSLITYRIANSDAQNAVMETEQSGPVRTERWDEGGITNLFFTEPNVVVVHMVKVGGLIVILWLFSIDIDIMFFTNTVL